MKQEEKKKPQCSRAAVPVAEAVCGGGGRPAKMKRPYVRPVLEVFKPLDGASGRP
ncbi:MAG: hypothetical protein IJ722_02025 [Alloprevotella sp.]|nr:hypothetical protein [Alloprevotella sp.]